MRSDNGYSSHSIRGSAVRVAVVGSGDFAELHAAAFAANPDCDLVGIVSRTSERAKKLADRYSARGAYSSVPELLADQKVDAVSVVTAGNYHLEPTLVALEAGAHVLLEKPVVMNGVDARVLQAAAKSARGFVMPAHILRFSTPYVELRERLQTGAVGKPRALSFRRHRTSDHDKFFPDVHPVFMTMIHDIDLALWLTGSTPVRVSARQIDLSARSQPLAVWAEVEMADGALLSFQTSWSLAGGTLPDAFEVIGDRGTLAMALVPRVADYGPESTVVDDCLTPTAGHGALREEIRTFVDAVRSNVPPVEVTLDEALVGIDLAERIVAAAESNRIEAS